MPVWHYSVGEAHQRLATETNTITGATIGFNTDLLGTYTPGSTGTDPRSALTARLIPTRMAQDLFAGWWSLIQDLGAVPRVLVWDGEGAVGRWRRGASELTGATQGFRGTLGAKVIICRPGDPEAKGVVERANGYLETSFLPGRTFTGPGDFNSQLQGWLKLANSRPKRVLGCAATQQVGADRAAMLTLPPVAPVTGWSSTLRLPRDYYVS